MEFTLPRRVIESSLRNVYADPGKVTPELVDRYLELTLREGNRRALAQRFAQAPAGIDPDRIAALKCSDIDLMGQLATDSFHPTMRRGSIAISPVAG